MRGILNVNQHKCHFDNLSIVSLEKKNFLFVRLDLYLLS